MLIPTIKLNDHTTIPQIGFGLYLVEDQQTNSSVQEAFKAGYRSIDSAQIYQNEAGLGHAIKEGGIKREELYITTKIWNSEQGYDSTLKSFDVSMSKLGLEKLDLLLIHWPSAHRGLYMETWKAMIQLQRNGRVKSIGVSNFAIEHLKNILDGSSVVPVINQIELHPHFQQNELRAFHDQHNIKTESWSPLGQGKVIADPVIKKIADKHKKTPAQVILRWHMENGLIAIPKSVTPARIVENIHIFDFKLDESDLAAIAKVDDKNGRIGPDPVTATF
jgi:2,5-diketo-D-gluconate reductase A